MIRKYENKIKFLHLTIFLATLLELRMESGEFFLIRFFKEIWRLKKLSPLLKKIAKKKKKKKNLGTHSGKNTQALLRQVEPGLRKDLRWLRAREEDRRPGNLVDSRSGKKEWRRRIVCILCGRGSVCEKRERERDRSGVCKRKKSFSQWLIRQVRVPDPWWRATRACTPMDTLWRSSLCTRREPYVHHLTLAVFSFFLCYI